jgi:hypothetical protein
MSRTCSTSGEMGEELEIRRVYIGSKDDVKLQVDGADRSLDVSEDDVVEKH